MEATTKILIADENPTQRKNLREGLARAGYKFIEEAANGEEAVILGAFGCGAFRNDPNVVSAAAAAIVPRYRTCFKVIEFAVFCRPGDTRNFDAFKRALG